MKEFLKKLEKENIIISDKSFSIVKTNFDFPTHIKNSIYSYLCQNQLNSSFSKFLIKNKKNYLKENKAKIKKFFRGLVYFIKNLNDINKKKFYFYLFENDLSRKLLKKIYNINHKLINNSGLKIKLKEFFQIENFIPIFKEILNLNQNEFLDFQEKLEKNIFYKQYISISFVKLSVLEIFLLRECVWKKKIVFKPDFKNSFKTSNFTKELEINDLEKNEKNIFEKHKNIFNLVNKKKFSCFRFDFSIKKKNKKNNNRKQKIEKNDVKELVALNLLKFNKKTEKEEIIKEMLKKEDFDIEYVKNKEFKESQDKYKRKFLKKKNYPVIADKNIYREHLKIIQNINKN